MGDLRSQVLSALGSATGNDLATVAVGHSFTEAVLFGSVPLLRLIGSLHRLSLRFLFGLAGCNYI